MIAVFLAPPQVELYTPQRSHAHYGVVRSIVRDADDVGVNGTVPFFLDSDGRVSDAVRDRGARNTIEHIGLQLCICMANKSFMQSVSAGSPRCKHPPLPPVIEC